MAGFVYNCEAMCSATWLCCSNMLPLRGEQQATDYNLAKAYIH